VPCFRLAGGRRQPGKTRRDQRRRKTWEHAQPRLLFAPSSVRRSQVPQHYAQLVRTWDMIRNAAALVDWSRAVPRQSTVGRDQRRRQISPRTQVQGLKVNVAAVCHHGATQPRTWSGLRGIVPHDRGHFEASYEFHNDPGIRALRRPWGLGRVDRRAGHWNGGQSYQLVENTRISTPPLAGLVGGKESRATARRMNSPPMALPARS